jgi:hypothetical protein
LPPAGTYGGVGLFSLRSLVRIKAGENARRAADLDGSLSLPSRSPWRLEQGDLSTFLPLPTPLVHMSENARHQGHGADDPKKCPLTRTR